MQSWILEDGCKHILLLEQSSGLLLSVYVNYLLHDSFASVDQKASNQMTVTGQTLQNLKFTFFSSAHIMVWPCTESHAMKKKNYKLYQAT